MESATYEYKKYVCTPSTLKKTIEKYGVGIIPSVLNEKECDAMNKGMWDTLEYVTQNFDDTTCGPIDRNNEDTWRSFYEFFPQHSMLIQHFGIGHAQYVWDVRQNPKVVDIWSKLWDTKPEDLLVSFDGVAYNLPPEVTNRGWYRENNTYGGWLHTDQSYTRNEFECIQGWITANDVEDGDASLAILEGSHKYHEAFAKKFESKDKADWVKLENDEQYNFYVKGGEGRSGCPYRVIKCPKGSMVFWDSRTIHCGREPTKGRASPNIRNVAYICCTPRSLANEAALKKKIKYFEEGRLTNHWPHKIKVFGKKPFTRGKSIQEFEPLPEPKLTALGRALAGYPLTKELKAKLTLTSESEKGTSKEESGESSKSNEPEETWELRCYTYVQSGKKVYIKVKI